MNLIMRRLRRIAADEVVEALARRICELASVEMLAESAGLMLKAWRKAVDDLVIDESFESFGAWLEAYASVCVQDLVTEAKQDPTVADQLAGLTESELGQLEQLLTAHVLDQAPEVAPQVAAGLGVDAEGLERMVGGL